MNQPAASELLHHGDGALADERDRHRMGAHAVARDAAGGVGGAADGQYLTDAKSMTGTVPTNLPPAPIFKHPEQEDEAEGVVLVTIREDAPLDFRARACNNRLGVRGGRRTSGRRAGSARQEPHWKIRAVHPRWRGSQRHQETSFASPPSTASRARMRRRNDFGYAMGAAVLRSRAASSHAREGYAERGFCSLIKIDHTCR